MPECTLLSLPSAFTTDERHCHGLAALALQEVELRKGQANDALQSLCLALGQKTMLYRVKVRNQQASTGKTRTWKEVGNATYKVTRYARSYERARKALEGLGCLNQDIYKPLQEKDLSMSADILEENRYNQKNDELAWFWRIGDGNIVDPQCWMAECKCDSISEQSIILSDFSQFTE